MLADVSVGRLGVDGKVGRNGVKSLGDGAMGRIGVKTKLNRGKDRCASIRGRRSG